jgi:hypothetical protein
MIFLGKVLEKNCLSYLRHLRKLKRRSRRRRKRRKSELLREKKKL